MKLNNMYLAPIGYERPPLDEQTLYGPDDLAEFITHYRDWTRSALAGSFGPAPISNEGLARLVELAFYASMMPEEGRYFRFNLVNTEGSYSAATFSRLKLESADSLRRLAPACAHQDCAFRVIEDGGMLWCDGLEEIGPMGYEIMPGLPRPGRVGRSASLHVRVRGPGHLVAIESGPGYELRGGVIRNLTAFTALDPVKKMLAEISDNLQGQFAKKTGTAFPPESRQIFSSTVQWVIEMFTQFAVEARRGSAFVFLPAEPTDGGSYIDPKYHATSPDLGADVVSYWEDCFGVNQDLSMNDYRQATRRWMSSRTRMLTHADVVGNLSCVDGCVVLNRRLQLCSFGSEIKIPEDTVNKSPRAFKDFHTGEVWPDDRFFDGIGGTRHKSAARLCKAHAGVLVLVVSQDGELRVFSSNTDSVHAFGPIDTHWGYGAT